MLRYPAVAGMFYEENKAALQLQLDGLWPEPGMPKRSALGAMVPHAGYVFSGRTAAKVYATLKPADVYFLLGPTHSGQGGAIALSRAAEWETPLGRVLVDGPMSAALKKSCSGVSYSDQAHEGEHAIEVQLPFLQKMSGGFSIVPIGLGTHCMTQLRRLGESIAALIQNSRKKCVVLASSDMNHFASLEDTQTLDKKALQPLLALDAEGLMETVAEQNISMCGVGPAVVMAVASKALGATRAELIDYTTSAEVSGDEDRVVGYAGVLVCADT
ncbi:AmmeMemoRadiSam system protein B [bacterium]|nr:AmmeMemoRadiSam system protein B [bacterium]